MPRRAPVVLAALVLAGCGGGGGGAEPKRSPAASSQTRTPAPERTATPASARSDVAAIRGWADALRGGDVEKAVSFWAIPATAANGGPPFELRTRAAVRLFNQALPCGAVLESTERRGGFVLATFRLTERPGPGECGSGTGNRVRTAFQIRRGRIVQWLRATDPAPASDVPGGATS